SYNPLFNVYPEALIIQPDGKILAHGVAANNPGNTYRGYLFRYFPDGTPDTSLDGDGELVFSDVSYGGLNNTDQRSLVVMPNGKMLVMHGGITRYNANGSLDTSFGNNGSAVTGINLYSFFYPSDGKILCPGTTNSRAALLRFNANGSVDGGFGNSGGGYADLPPTSRYSHLLQQPDGKIVTCGNKDNDFLLGRHFSQTINSDTREPAFDPKVSVSPNPSQGVLTVEFELNEAQAVALVLYDLSGRQLRSLMAPTQLPEGVFSRIFHLTDMPSGTYLLQIRGQEGEKSCVISLH
ncbi:MAG: T9SS type A sorting domain-containing protein, partial [Saprospiraceae bacterium]|nr:T9SS type A sorting domain-containing protein [Saprospiraceae bacterium]